MKRLFGLCILMLTLVFGVNFSAYAVDYVFSVTTESIASGGTFTFKISASGTFYVDCGTGGTLSGTGVSGTTITKSNTSQYTYTCTYSGTAGAKTIQFGGSATGYVTNDTAAILFSSPALIASLSGNLASVFPQLGTSTSQLPKFWNTFKDSVNLQTIPVTLFSGITRGTRGMFYGLFDGCTGLTDIPQGLFNGITVAGQYMFNFTFRGCTSLVSTPLLFNTTSISCAGQEGVFKGLFMNCTSLQNVPTNLFAGVTDGTAWQFERLFMGCTGLTSIPPTLFSNVTSLGEGTFSETFSGCTNLSGYIPSTLFSGLLSQSTPPTAGYLMSNAFYNTALATSCPSGTERYYTAYDSYWSPKVSCLSDGTTFTVTYACGSGSGNGPTDSNTYAPYATVTTLSNTCTPPSGGTFSKWLCGSANVDAGSTFVINANTTCTAQYSFPCATNGNINSGYTRLEYIESSGTQYINTRQSVRFGDEFYFDYMKMSNSTSTENKGYGFTGGSSVSGGGRMIDGKIQMYVTNAGNVAYSPSLSSSAALQKRYVENWVISSGKLTSTLTEVGTSNVYNLTANNYNFTSSFVAANPLWIFRDYDSNYANPSSMRIYLTWLKRSNGDYAFYLVPAKRNSDNVFGMCDTVTGDFYTNGGTGTFTAGPVVSDVVINITWDGNNSTQPTSCLLGDTFIPPTPEPRVGYIFKGWRIKERCGIPGLDASISPTYNFFANNQTWNGTQSGMGGMNGCEYGITTENTWAVEFSYGTVWGRANCNYTSGTANTAGTPTLGNIGTACWCQVTGFKTSGDNCPSGPQCTTTASSWWVLQGEKTFEEQCVPSCAGYCVSAIQTNATFRTALFGVAGQ